MFVLQYVHFDDVGVALLLGFFIISDDGTSRANQWAWLDDFWMGIVLSVSSLLDASVNCFQIN